MSEFHIRTACLDDTAAVSRLFRGKIDVWQRIGADGSIQNLPYEALTIYERWTHGGAWMSIEIGAVWLSHLLRTGAIPLVIIEGNAQDNDLILGYIEVYPGSEPEPFGNHLHIANFVSHFESGANIQHALLDHIAEIGAEKKFSKLTVSFSPYDAETKAYYDRLGWQPIQHMERYTLTAQIGQGFYKAVDHHDANPAQIRGLQMSVGRQESARYHWETLWPRLWDGVKELTARRVQHLRFNASGQDALVVIQEQPYDPRSAEIYCWANRPLSPQMLTAIRDWTHRQDYRTLIFDIPENMGNVLGTEAEKTPHRQVTYALGLSML